MSKTKTKQVLTFVNISELAEYIETNHPAIIKETLSRPTYRLYKYNPMKLTLGPYADALARVGKTLALRVTRQGSTIYEHIIPVVGDTAYSHRLRAVLSKNRSYSVVVELAVVVD